MRTLKQHMTFAEYFLCEKNEGKTEFRVVVKSTNRDGEVEIYIHPLGKDGDSRDFLVDADDVTDITQWLPEVQGD